MWIEEMQVHERAKGKASVSPDEVLHDYRLALTSRYASVLGRKEVLNGKAKFGIFGDGKELAQIALAKTFAKGDWRSGYYRDQTMMLALESISVKQFFAQLYADTEGGNDPSSAGRQMTCHFASRFIAPDGSWLDQTALFNSSADLSPTGGQMARLVGLAYASKLYGTSEILQQWDGAVQFSRRGREVAFGTIGNASTSEGVFWEALNAAGVLQIPMALSIWDDHYGISVPNEYQSTKGDIFALLQGFKSEAHASGYDLYQVKGYDYPGLVSIYQTAIEKCRRSAKPCVIHVIDMTQPQGHSTSGSHERYKTPARLAWEAEHDCIAKMRQWIITESLAGETQLRTLEESSLAWVQGQMEEAWAEFQGSVSAERDALLPLLEELQSAHEDLGIAPQLQKLRSSKMLFRRDLQSVVTQVCVTLPRNGEVAIERIHNAWEGYSKDNARRYNSYLYSEGSRSPLKVQEIPAGYNGSDESLDGRQVIQRYFAKKLACDPRVFIIGEDVGKLGGVNLEFEGLAEQFGSSRISDTGIREATIIGQGIGAAMRGLRPIADIQYLDYLIYGLQGLSDDVASLHYRTVGAQCAPLIVRTKGHRLEGIWHTGSPLGMLLNSLRGMHLCVPRNCVQAAGMYETLLQGDDPAVVIEVLNGYRLKETLPQNLGDYRVPLGKVEILHPGTDITVVSYGATLRIIESALPYLTARQISIELIDVQTLLPFDVNADIAASIAKTNAVIFCDEDVPGGASAYMLQQVLELQRAYDFLDAPPRTLTAKPHRAAYGSDGDYFSKPNREDFIALVLEMMQERGIKRWF
jgi:pyruvate/2-oxoglutarate/acetoin dehydrogenase E1 component/TPP-dependent pyruvate/acetoin dehydrogenase alpha subunit